MTHHLVGAAEIAAMLGITRQRVNAIVQTHEDFPDAEAELAGGSQLTRAPSPWPDSPRPNRLTLYEVRGVEGLPSAVP